MGTKFLKMSHIWLSGLALVLGLNSACSSGGSTASSDNATAPVISACGGNNVDSGLLTNGNFESGSDNWTGVAANPLSDVNGNVVNYANVETAAANPWDVNLQQVVELTQGLTYKLSFSAMSNVERKIGAGIGLNEDPWSNTQQEVSLSTACQNFELELTAANFGGANSRVFFDMGAEVGEVIIDDVSLVETTPSAGPDVAPSTAAPVPSHGSASVISLFSDNYTDVSVDTWRTSWSSGTLTEELIDGSAMKKYASLDFVGIEATGANSIDASGMTHLHIDIWSADITSFGVKLVDWGADNAFGGGDDTEHQVDKANPNQGEWVSYDIPLSEFTNLTNRSNLSQFILVGQPTGSTTVYVDNVYFYSSTP